MIDTKPKNEKELRAPSYPERTHPLIYISILVVTITGFICGYGTVILSGALPFVRVDYGLTVRQVEIIVSAILLSAAFGALIAWPISWGLGRRSGIFISAILFFVGPLILTLSDDYQLIILGRVILGVGIGLSTVCSLIYLSEIVPANIRGSSVCILNLVYYLGASLAYIIAWSFAHSEAWRWMIFMTLVPAVILFILLFYIPETPQWYVSHKKSEKAKAVLGKLRFAFEVDTELDILEESVEYENERSDKFWTKGVFKAFLIGILVPVFMEATGLDAILFYAPSILKVAGLKSVKTMLITGFGIALTSLVFSFIAILLIDLWGRRKLMLYGLPIMFLSLVWVGILFKRCVTCGVDDGLIIFGLITFTAGFAIGIGTVGWLLISEIYPLKVRSFAVGFTLTIKWLASFLIARYFLSTLSDYGAHLTFWIYALVSLAAWCFVYFFVPETAGKRLEEIETFWIEGKEHGTKIEV